VLVHCGASDAVAGIGFVVIAVCALEDTINRQSQYVITVANSVMEGIMLATGLLRAYLIGISSYERYVALCDPFNYETNRTVQNIGRFFVSCWVGCLAVITILQIVFFGGTEQCFVLSRDKVRPAAETLIAFFLYFIPTVVTMFCLGKVGLELRRMSQRAVQPARDDLVKTASKYVLFTSILFYFSYAITIVTVLIKHYSQLTFEQRQTGIHVLYIYLSLYGIFICLSTYTLFI